MSVENIALDYYINSCSYTDGKHCEGSLVQALFVLFFWDIIYYPDPPVTGTFLSKIQQAPLDMKTQYFYTNRKHLIDTRLEQIASEWKRSLMLQFLKYSYDNNSCKSGIYNVNSVIPDTEADSLLETLVDCIGRKILSEIFRRLVKNPGAYRSGMPDLLVWNVDTKTVSRSTILRYRLLGNLCSTVIQFSAEIRYKTYNFEKVIPNTCFMRELRF